MARNSSGGFNKFLNFIGLVDDYQDEYQPSNAGRPSTVVPPRKNKDDVKRRTVNAPSGRTSGSSRTYGGTADSARTNRRTYGGTSNARTNRRAFDEENTNRYAYGEEAEAGYYAEEGADYYAEEKAPRASRRTASAPRTGRHSESARRPNRYESEPPRRSRFEEPEEPAFDDEPMYDDEPRHSRSSNLTARPIKYTLYSLQEVRSVILDLVRNRLILISFGPDVDPAMYQRMKDTIAGALVALDARMDYVNDYTIMLVPAPMLLPEDREPRD